MALLLRIIAIGLAAIVTLALLIAGYAGLTWMRASNASLAVYEGEARLAGLQGDVAIRRDAYAVPHIEAESEADAWFALGFVHAQDRLFQMDLMRRTFSGRLSALVGGQALQTDRLFRLAGLPGKAARALERFPDPDRAMVEAYAAGVNAYVNSDLFAPTPEHILLHAPMEPWTALDTVYVSLQFSNFAGPFTDDALIPARLARHAPAPDAVEFLRPYRPDTPAHIEDSGPVEAVRVQAAKVGELSNAWVVDGRFSASGAPLLANDPQLPTTSPGVWQLARLSWPGQELAGVTAPGQPGVFVGRSDTTAWGVTYASVETSDASLLRRDPDDPSRYLTPDGPRAYEIEIAEIEIRFGADDRFEIRRAPAGVVIPDSLRSSPIAEDSYDVAVLDRSDVADCECLIPAMLQVNRAADLDGMMQGMAIYQSAAINLLLADSAGRIGYVMPGGVPQRPAEVGAVIRDNPDGAPPFTRLVPYAENPRVVDPPRGRIISGNQAVAGADYPHFLTARPTDSNRARRILELLQARPVHDPDSFAAMQADTLSIGARTLTPILSQTEPAGPADAALLDALAAWDGRYDAESPAPLIFTAWIHALNEALLADELGEMAWLADQDPRLHGLTAVLDGPLSHWCDDQSTPDEEDCAAMLQTTLSTARARLEARWGPDPAGWRWIEAAEYRAPHLAFAGLPVLGEAFARTLAYPGGPDVNRVFHWPWSEGIDPQGGRPFSPSLQMIVDLADPAGARFSVSSGQSGHFRSPHYHDLAEVWMRGEYVTLSEPGDDVRTLRLTPAP